MIPIIFQSNIHQVIGQLAQELHDGVNLVVMNLCDGTEIDGYPGVTVLKELEKQGIPFTGSDSYFYDLTTSKPVLKDSLLINRVETSEYVVIRPGFEDQDILKAESIIGWPMIVKPAVSYASLSISYKSVVNNIQEAVEQVKKVFEMTSDGVFVERFLAGREFTVLCTGNESQGVVVYPAAERVFNEKLGTYQRLLAFDQYWDGCEIDGTVGKNVASHYSYELAPQEWQNGLMGKYLFYIQIWQSALILLVKAMGIVALIFGQIH